MFLLANATPATPAYVDKTFTAVDELWITLDVSFPIPGGAEFLQDFVNLFLVGGVSQVLGVYWDATSGWGFYFTGGSANKVAPAPTSDVYQTIEVRWQKGGAVELWVAGVQVWVDVNGDADQADRILVGQCFTADITGQPVSIDDVKVGTTRGGSDLFSDDFESGNLSAWDALVGDVRIGPIQPPVVRYEDPPVWRLLLGGSSGRILGLLDKRSTNRAFTMNLDEPWSHTGLVSSEDPEINIPFPDPTSPAYLTQNMRKIWALRRENTVPPYDCGWSPCGPYVCRWSGIVMTLEDVGADAPTTRYTAYDSWQYLMSRPCRIPDTDGEIVGADGFAYIDARPSDIVQEQLLLTLDIDGEVWIDMDDAWVEDSDVLTGSFVISQGESVGEVWTRCCATGMMDIILLPIFDPLGRPGMLSELHIYQEAGVTQHNAVFGWSTGPHNVTELSRLVDGTQLANTVTMIGGDGDSATQIDTDSQTDYGRYYSQQVISDADASEHALLNQFAKQELIKRTHGVITVEFQPAPEYSPLPLRDYGPGDWVPVWADDRFREPLQGWLVVP